MKRCRHRKLTGEWLALFQAEARLRAELLPYEELAKRSGLALGTVKQVMARLIREHRDSARVVHRGTNLVDLEAIVMELSA